MSLCTADVHLTANEADEYRWSFFDVVRNYFRNSRDRRFYVLGDLTDLRDRHPAALVNRLVDEFKSLSKMGVESSIIMGNHDKSLRGDPYWKWLSAIPQVRYYAEPAAKGDLILLPFSPDPRTEWKDIDFTRYRCAFIHQTVNGAVRDNGTLAEVDNFPILPRDLKVYAGDLHVPQRIGNVTYIGAPHPKNYGDDHPCRLVVLDDRTWEIADEIELQPARKHMIAIGGIDDLDRFKVRKGDMARVRFSLDASKIEQWPAEREVIIEWAKENGVHIASVEAAVEQRAVARPQREEEQRKLTDPEEVLISFANAEGLDEGLLNEGLNLLREERNA